MEPVQEQPMVTAAQRRLANNNIDSDDQNQQRMIVQMMMKKQALNPTGKKLVKQIQTTPQKQLMDIQNKKITMLKFNDLPQQIVFYLTQVFPFGQKLFISGVLEHGQAFNLLAVEPQRELFFCLKPQYSDNDIISQNQKQRARKQITSRFRLGGINQIYGQFVQKQYVFQIDSVPRNKRWYYRVRYPFKAEFKDPKDQIKPDQQGQTYKFVFGTTYTPLQIFIINTQIKGPSWVKINKKFISQNKKSIEYGLCGELQFPQIIQIVNQKTTPPNMKVMSISIKAVVPAQVKSKKLFNTNRVDQLHIYAISYFICEDYLIQIKPKNYFGKSKTLFLKQFGAKTDNSYILCQNQKQMFALFQAQINKYDPDVLVCHDSAKIIDTLIQRMSKIGDRTERPRLGRLVFPHQLSKSNQNQRINSTIAGRLLCDTYLHAKDMIKSVDYQLQSMAVHIKPQKTFKGLSDDQAIGHLNQNRAYQVVKKSREQAQITFALMNHLQILQITRQLSNICGITWKRSLQNQRAQRNEYLIMHECFKRDLIIPDKFRKDKNADDDEDVDRKKYQGGHVIEPQKGFYKDYILLLDFNSLYPSIIRQYNVCFSVIKRPLVPLSVYYKNKQKKDKFKQNNLKQIQLLNQDDNFVVSPPPKDQCSKQKWGFLPQLIDKIVQRRKKCKKLMKNAPPQKVIILDIQQKCYKLVANSIYGCLGFSISRFYSKHLAALITRMGRQALLRAKDIVGGMNGMRVIYGDTDSLMIEPVGIDKDDQRQKLLQIKKMADDLKKNINKQYDNLEIDVDGIFKPLILLMKKKYVARKLTNYEKIFAGIQKQLHFNIEYKGIEVVRRDGFELARSFLRKTLQILMNSTKPQPQDTYQQIYNYAKGVNQNFSKYSYKQFLFSRQLNKAPSQYSKGETIPHVKVALDKLKAGQKVETLVNHTIYYIVCKPKDKSQDSLAKCCFDDKAYERSIKFSTDEKDILQIDQEYYKKQLLQPVIRIIQHLQDFSLDRLLQEMGLDDQSRKKFKRQLEHERQDGEAPIQTCISQTGVQKSKMLCEFLGQMNCDCGFKVPIAVEGRLSTNCPSCNRNMISSISNKITYVLKMKIDEYYNNKFKCRCGDCCKIKYKPRSNVPFQVHELVYVMKDLCSYTMKMNRKDQVVKKLQKLDRKMQQFLQSSDFQKVKGVNNIFKL